MFDIKEVFYKFIDTIYKIIILNLCAILGIVIGLGIFGIVPSFVTVLTVWKDQREEKKYPLFKGFFQIYFSIFKKTIVISIINFIILVLEYCLVAYAFSQKENSVWNMVYYVSLFFSFILALIQVNQNLLFVYYQDYKTGQILLQSITHLYKNGWRTFVILFMMFLLITLCVTFVYGLIFLYISGFFYLITRLMYNRIMDQIIQK